MQHLNWDDLRVFVAVDRARSFAQAARALGLEPSTVGRRITRLETSLDVQLFERTPSGLTITATGLAIREHAEALAQVVARIVDRSGANAAEEGRVRLATTGLLTPVLLQHFPTFQQRFPAIDLDIVVSRDAASVVAGEADLALRLKAPGARDVASPSSIARRLGALSFSAWRHPGLAAPWPAVRYLQEDAPWIPGHAWTEASTRPGGLRTGSMMTALEAVERGLGVGVVLDCLVATRSADLVPVARGVDAADLWVVQRQENRTFARIRAVVEWLGAIPWG